MTGRLTDPGFLQVPWKSFRNMNSEDCPVGGVMRVTDTALVDDNIVAICNKPDGTARDFYLVNTGPIAVPKYSTANPHHGSCSPLVHHFGIVLIDSQASTPAFGDIWGPQSGQWHLTNSTSLGRFFILGDRQDDPARVVAMQQLSRPKVFGFALAGFGGPNLPLGLSEGILEDNGDGTVSVTRSGTYRISCTIQFGWDLVPPSITFPNRLFFRMEVRKNGVWFHYRPELSLNLRAAAQVEEDSGVDPHTHVVLPTILQDSHVNLHFDSAPVQFLTTSKISVFLETDPQVLLSIRGGFLWVEDVGPVGAIW